jgi:transposase
MIIDFEKVNIFIKPGHVDFRKQINGLSVLVEKQMKKNIFSASIFVFSSRDKKRLKVIYWDKNGFCMWLKRLEKDKFPWPDTEEDAMELTFDKFKMLLSGIDFFHAHQPLKYTKLF